MTFLPILVMLFAAPFVAVAWSVRDHQLMTPAAGAVDLQARLRRDRTLQGAVVGWRSLAPLVRTESVRLLRHPAPYLVGVPLCALALSSHLYSSIEVVSRTDVASAVLVVPYAWGTLIAANLLTLRSRRWRSDELLATTPVPERSRTLAHLLATLAMVPGALALIAIWCVTGVLSGRTIGTPRIEVLAVAPLIVVGAGCVGVAVARWLPRPVFGWVAVIATLALQVNFGALDPRWRWLHFSMAGSESINYSDLAPAHHWTHFVYVIGGILLVAFVALARYGVDKRVGVLCMLAVSLMLVTGWIQTRPLTDEAAAEFARRLENPGWNQRCEARVGFTICADLDYGEHIALWSPSVDGVLRRLPEDVKARGLTVRQRPLIDARDELSDDVATRIDPTIAWPDDDEVAVGPHWATAAPEDADTPGMVQLALAFRVASKVVGLPPDAWWSQSSQSPRGSADWASIPLGSLNANVERADAILSPFIQCVAADQARSVVAIWLAGQSTPAARAELRRRAGEIMAVGQLDAPVTFDATSNYREGMPNTLAEQGTVVPGTDVVAAVALLDQDDEKVAATLHRHWNDFANDAGSGVSTSELLGWFDTDAEKARTIVAASAPAFDIESHPEDVSSPPAVTGPCPS